MNSKMKEQLTSLLPCLKANIRRHASKVQQDPDVYGYALLLGEELELCEAIAVTNREQDLSEHLGSEQEPEYRYFPDEWQEWHHDAFTEFNTQLSEIYEQFRVICPESDDCDYNQDEWQYMDDIHELYLTAMAETLAEGLFHSAWYRIIWISDCDFSIIERSFYQLNTGRPIQEAGRFFSV